MPEGKKFRFKYSNPQPEINRFEGIEDIIKATREQNFLSPYINEPEKVQIDDTKFIQDAPRKREADSFTQSLLKGISTPLLSSYQELGQAGDEFKQGKIGSGVADLLKGTLHTAMTPITAPLGAVFEGLKGTGEVGGEIAKGLEQTMNLPFDAVKQGSELVKQAIELTGLDISDSETSKKFNDLAVEVGGLLAMGKGIREAKKYVETKVPEIAVLPKDPELVIKSQETKPVEGLTQEKLPTDIIKELPKQEPVELIQKEVPTKETSTKDFSARLYDANKLAVEKILNQEGVLTPQQVSRRLTSMVERGELSRRVSVETVKQLVKDWDANRPKRPVQVIEGAKNSLDIALPEEMNSTRTVSFDRHTGLTIKEVLEQNPEFKPYIKDLTDINKVTTQLNSLYWKKRHKEPLPELEKTPETSFEFGENKPIKQTDNIISTKEFRTEEGKFTNYDTQVEHRGRPDMFTVLKDKDGYVVRNAFVPDNMQRQGIATDFYKKMNEESLQNTGKPLRSSPARKMPSGEMRVEMTPDAIGLWDSFVEKGLAEKISDRNYRFREQAKVEETTSVKNEMMNKEREFRGLEPLETKDVRKQEPLIEDAQRKIESGEIDPNKLAKEIVDNPRILSDGDVAVLQVNARRLKNETTKLVDEISKETDPAKVQELRQKALQLEEQYNLNDIASKQTGTDTARALAIRRLELKDDYSVAPLIQRAKIANKGEIVPEEIRVKLETYSKEIAEAEAKLKEYQNAYALAQAEKLLQESIRQDSFKERTQKRQVKKQDLDLEYEELVKEFAKSQQYNVLVDPKQIEIMVKAVKNRVKKGVTNLEQAVDQIYQDMKKYMPELTKEDIYDAIGGLGRFQKMSEADIKSELGKIRKQRTDESLQKSYKTRLENRKAELEEMLRTGNFEKTPKRKTKMNPELSKLKDDVDLLKLKADREIRVLEEANKTKGEKAIGLAEEITNIPRAMVTSVDLSAPMRQGAVFTYSHPQITLGKDGAFRKMFDYFKDDKYLRELRREIEEHPDASLFNKMGIYFANEKSNLHRIAGKEESYMTDLPSKIPVYGKLFRGSQRAYTGFLDKQRLDIAEYYVNELKKSGQTFESNPKLYKDIGKFINLGTGRGTLGGFERSASALSVGLFSPRLIASRLTLMNPAYYFKLDPLARKMVMKDMLKFVGTGTTIASLGYLMGADVGTDPRSTDFMKIKIGDTRLDVWGGFQQYGVLATRLATGQTKNANDKVRELSGDKYPFRNRWDVALRFGEQKMSPFAGFIRDYLKGEDFEGNKFELSDQLIKNLVPLYLQDMYDATKEDGVEGSLKVLPGIFGVGTQTYKPKRQTLKF